MSDVTYPSARSSAFVAQSQGAPSSVRPAGAAAVFWCGLLLLSLSYELPLHELTSYDRLNPRLFDVVLVLAAVFSGWRLRVKDAFVGSWLAVTLIFVMIGGLSFGFLLPGEYRYFSLFYSIKYIEILLFLLIISGFDWNREQIATLIKCFAIGVALAGVWGLLQKLGILPSERFLPNGEQINLSRGAVLATYGPTYFHSGVMGAMGATAALALRMQNRISWLLFLPLFASGAFLAIFAGSRAGLALLLIACSLILFRRSLYVVLGVGVVSVVLLLPGVLDYLTGESITVQRILDTEHSNSVENRISMGSLAQFGRLIDYHGAGLLLYGGGFYAVPMPDLSGLVKYRVGYGIHNIHLFPLEQAGILGFFASLTFWVVALAKGLRARTTIMGASGLALLASIFAIGWAGQIFFLGFGTENMLAAQLGVIFLLLTYSSAKPREQIGDKQDGATVVATEQQADVAEAAEIKDGAAAGQSAAATEADDDSPLGRFLAR